VATNYVNQLTEHLYRSVLHDGAGRTDGQLLGSFIQHKDHAALAALVRRHGPMVLGACSRMLRSHHDAEDAFQATFLVLVQKAATLPDREMVGNWLYGVAHQTAVRMRALAARRAVRERQVAVMPDPTSAEQPVWDDLEPILDEELARLPQKYRVLIVLCQLEGKTLKEVARQLAIPEGTVASRLATARAMLAKRLSRRGVVVSGVLLGAVVSSPAASGCVPVAVGSSTIKTATLVAVGQRVEGAVSPTVAALVTGVTKAMFRSKIKRVLAVALVVGMALSGGGVAVHLFGGPAVVAQQPKDGGPGDPGVSSSKKDTSGLARANQGEKPKSDTRNDLDKLQGTWLVVTTEEGGNEIEAALKETFVVKGGKMTYCRDGKVQVTMRITLAPGKAPKAMDVVFLDGKEKGMGNHAIYQLDGDRLKVRMNDKFGGNSVDERPTDFSTAKGKEAVLFILKREKEGARPAPANQGEKQKSTTAGAKKDLDTLQGTWLVVTTKEGGNEIEAALKETFVVKGGKMTYYRGGKVQVTMKITLEAREDPKAMDLEFLDGREKGQKNHAIYELVGDRLKIRMNDKFGGNGEDERPTDFSTAKGKGAVLFILERVKK
jgi:RNA polymerase sigma factor (sigma-70 family)